MEGWLNLLHGYVDTLVWPVLVAAGFVVFRSELSRVLDRLSKVSFGDVSVELAEKIENLEKSAERAEAERRTDDIAISMVDEQLSQTLSPPFEPHDLMDAIKKASSVALQAIYSSAKETRRSAWHAIQRSRAASYPSDRERDRAVEQARRWMRRTIPIFRALTELEHRENWHRYYAQLGYALKDTGDVEGARKVLDKATEQWIRQTGKPVSPHYRYNWVYCEIRIDNDHHQDGRSSDGEVVAAVTEAIRESSTFPPLLAALKADPEAKIWMQRNGLDWDALGIPGDDQ